MRGGTFASTLRCIDTQEDTTQEDYAMVYKVVIWDGSIEVSYTVITDMGRAVAIDRARAMHFARHRTGAITINSERVL